MKNSATIVNVVGYAAANCFADHPVFFLVTDNRNDLHIVSDKDSYIAVDETTSIDPAHVINHQYQDPASVSDGCALEDAQLVHTITKSVVERSAREFDDLNRKINALETNFLSTVKLLRTEFESAAKKPARQNRKVQEARPNVPPHVPKPPKNVASEGHSIAAEKCASHIQACANGAKNVSQKASVVVEKKKHVSTTLDVSEASNVKTKKLKVTDSEFYSYINSE
ncbi:hypothetical protein CYMTET_3012 [Cymbomonas tetramitiformis]|uniref:Uncharacterized protein n=1 Tax=Cymbomonas tetramitiformis TaxID=36881 RepID=A0AAE0H4K9_9CHLO|nr:hypothetical protein CYMTET_3012 [Cymbomonas tetramitiformis]